MNARRRHIGRCLWLVLLLAVTAIAAAQQHPNKEKGFSADKLYNVLGLDTINTFNGNLVISIPLGQRFSVNGGLSYGFTAVYNGVVWDEQGDIPSPNTTPTYLEATSSRRSNAGNGWLVSLGRIVAPGDKANHSGLTVDEDGPVPNSWVYEGPDAHDHVFQPETSPGQVLFPVKEYTFIRMRKDILTGDRLVEFPDGMYQVFHNYSTAGEDPGDWRLTAMKDRFGNGVYVEYRLAAFGATTPGSGEPYKTEWVVKEYDNGDSPESGAEPRRVQHLYFDRPGGADYNQKVLREISLTAFGTTTSYIFFNYDFNVDKSAVSLSRPAWDRSTGDPNNAVPSETPVKMFLLKSITFQAIGESYTFDYIRTSAPHDTQLGSISRMFLPTGGSIGWEYREVKFGSIRLGVPDQETPPQPPPPAYKDQNVGVFRRTLYDEHGTAVPGAQWTYDWSLFTRRVDGIRDEETNKIIAVVYPLHRQVTVTSPDGTQTVNYYSAFTDKFSPTKSYPQETWSWKNIEYGLPLTHEVEVDGANGQKFALSTQTLAGSSVLRSTYVRYEPAGDPPREIARRTTYDADHSCRGAACATESYSRQDDGYGHFRQVSTWANFTRADGGLPSNFRTTFTRYNVPSVNTASPWVINTYSEQCVAQDGAFNTGDVSGCEGMPVPKTVQRFCFDTSNGFLKTRRVQRGPSPQANDIVTTFESEMAGTPLRQTGNVWKEHDYGADLRAQGDPGVEVTLDTCSANLLAGATARYNIVHTYDAGSLKTTQYQGAPFLSEDNDIDKSTGLIAVSRDTSRFPTTFTYDGMGRLKKVTPPDAAETLYDYHAFDGTNLPSVEATQDGATFTQSSDPSAPPFGKMYTVYGFDAFGRFVQEKNLAADDTMSVHKTTYDAMSRKLTVSETVREGSEPQHFTSFLYDHFGRVKQTTGLDGSVTTANYENEGIHHLTRTAPVNITGATTVVNGVLRSVDSNVSTEEYYDANGKLVQVEEKSGPTGTTLPLSTTGAKVTTLYGYDIGDRLSSVEMRGTEATQHRAFTYDSAGFLLSEQHPELGQTGDGTTVYGLYDARGHAGRKTTGTASDLEFVYDAYERLREVNRYGLAAPEKYLKTFDFGIDNPADDPHLGKLITAVRHNRLSVGDVVVTESYQYDRDAGRLTQRDTNISINGVSKQTFRQKNFKYTPWGQLRVADQPTCVAPACTAPSIAGGGTMLSSVENSFHNGQMVGVNGWASIHYEPNGFIRSITHTGGQVDEQIPDPSGIPRPQEIQFRGYCVPPSINASEPADQVQTQTTTAALSIQAPADAVSYQWYQVTPSGPLALPAQNSTTLQVPQLLADTQYFVRVTGAGCSADSRTATVSVPCAGISVTSTPVDKTVASGETVSFDIGVSPAEATIEWYQIMAQGDPVKVGNGAHFVTPPLAESTSYFVKVINGTCTWKGPSVTANVCAPLGYVSQPVAFSGVGDANDKLNADASVTVSGGMPPYVYSWKVNGSVVSTETSSLATSTYQVHLDYNDLAWRSVTVAVDVTSCSRSISMADPVTFSVQKSSVLDPRYCPARIFYFGPQSGIIAEPGQGLRLTVSMLPNEEEKGYGVPGIPKPEYSYRWYHNGAALPASFNQSYLDVTTYDHDNYYATVTCTNCNNAVITTPKAYLKVYGHCVLTPVTITPAAIDVNSGGTAILEAYSDWPNVHYQWYKGELGNTRVPVAHMSSQPSRLLVTDEPSTYWVRITNDCGQSLDSNLAIVNKTGAGACGAIVIHGTSPDAVMSSNSGLALTVDANSSSPITSYVWTRLNFDGTVDTLPGNEATNIIHPLGSAFYAVHLANSCNAVADSRYIFVRVNSCGTTTFSTDLPATIAAMKDIPFTASVTISNPAAVSNIQWYKRGPDDPVGGVPTGVTGPDFSGSFASSVDLWAHVTTTDGCTMDSRIAAVNVCVPADVTDTTDQSTGSVPGFYVWLGFRTAGTNLSYQWWVYDTPDHAARQLPNTTPNIQVHPMYTTRYFVKVSNACGTDTSPDYFVSMPPTITQLSASATTVMPGGQAQLTVLGDGYYMRYTWYKGHYGDTSHPVASTPVGEYATGPLTYQTEALTADTSYWAIATSGMAMTFSDEITVHVCEPMNVWWAQANANAKKGESQIIGLSALPIDPAVYYYKGQSGDVAHSTLISTTTSAGISIAPTVTTSYWARIYGGDRICFGDTPTLTIKVCVPQITTQPQSQMIDPGATVHLTVAADISDVTYQWYSGTTLLAGQTAATLDATPAADTTYKVKVTGSCGITVDSQVATVTICQPPVINNGPIYSTSIQPGGTADLGVAAVGTELSYQWYVGTSGTTTTPIGTNSNMLHVTPAVTTGYWCRVTGRCGTKDSPTGTVSVCPTISQQPTPALAWVQSGSGTTITVNANSAPISYQWYQGDAGDTSHPVGTNSNVFSTGPLTATTMYWVAVSSGACTTPSSVTTVNVCAINPTWLTATTAVKMNQTQTISISAPTGVTTVFYRGTAGNVAGSTVIQASSSALSTSVAPLVTTSYWVRVTDPATGCYGDTSTLTINVCIPQIVTNPQSQLINSGATAHLTVAADIPGVTYQWYSGSTPISGQTASSLDVSPTVDTTYKVRVSGTCTSYVDSQVATVTVCKPPVITVNPAVSVNLNPGQSYDLSVNATGTGLTYQWYVGTSGITTSPTGTNSAVLHVTPSATTSYWVKVSGSCGSQNSTTATVSVCPSITQQPVAAATNLHPGASTTITVQASGAPLTYQWYLGNAGDTSHPVGTNSNVLNTGALNASSTFWVMVWSGSCPVQSAAVTVNVCSLSPWFTTGISTQVRANYNQTLTVSTPAGNFSTIYRGTSGDVAGSTVIGSATTTVAPSVTTSYWARLTDPNTGCYGDTGTVTINVCIPTITTQPQSQTVNPSTPVTLTVAGNGGPLTYQWYVGTSGTTTSPVSGGTGSSLSVTPSATTSYWVRVTGPCTPAADSQTATVTICSNANITGQPVSPNAVYPNQSTSTSVTATGTGLTYQWYQGVTGNTSTPLSGKTSSVLSLTLSNTEQYWARVTAACGPSKDSLNAWLSVRPTINSSPANVTVNSGSTAYFVVGASGTYLTYQWYKNDLGTPVNGATQNYLYLPSVTQNASYLCMVGSGTAAVPSNWADATICSGPVIQSGPRLQAVGSCRFVIVDPVYDGTNFTYQWYQGSRGDVTHPAANGTDHALYLCTLGGTYWCRITNAETGCYTDTTAITVN